jgi:hypothetical protein
MSIRAAQNLSYHIGLDQHDGQQIHSLQNRFCSLKKWICFGPYRGLCCPCIGLWAVFASRVWWSEMILTGVRQDYLDVSRLDGRQNTSLIKES